MSFDDDFAADELVDLYAEFGVEATVTRGNVVAPVRVIIDRGQEQLGEHNQVVALVDRVRVQTAQWSFRQGDLLVWTDRLGTHSKLIERRTDGDGLESEGVLHG